MKEGDSDRQALLMQKLSESGPMVAVELRPPRAKLEGEDGMEAWIDLHHSLNRLTSEELFVFLTDNAVGEAEEENLAHVAANLGDEADLRRIVPILTAKHSLEYCRMFASRAVAGGFDALTVLGGDRGTRAVRATRARLARAYKGGSAGACPWRLGKPPSRPGGAGGLHRRT